MTDPTDTPLLEDEDGAPYPEHVQETVQLLRDQLRRANDNHTSARNRNNALGQAVQTLRDDLITGRVASARDIVDRLSDVLAVERVSTQHTLAELAACVCVENCNEDPPSACSLSGEPHVHPDDGSGTFGPCPVHPDAPGDH